MLYELSSVFKGKVFIEVVCKELLYLSFLVFSAVLYEYIISLLDLLLFFFIESFEDVSSWDSIFIHHELI
jgi:hypothetical protein